MTTAGTRDETTDGAMTATGETMTGTVTEMLDVNHLLRPETATGNGMTETRTDGQETVPSSVIPSPLVPETRNKRVRLHDWSCGQ